MTSTSAETDKKIINWLLVLGGGAIAVIVAGTFVFVVFYLKAWPGLPLPIPPPTWDGKTMQAGPMGAEGSTCSGPERYPCAPGTKCSVSDADWGVKYGKCVKDPAGAKPTVPPDAKK